MAAQGKRTDCLLIFDLDGTLYDTRTSFVPTMRIVYARCNLPYPSDRVILNGIGELPDLGAGSSAALEWRRSCCNL